MLKLQGELRLRPKSEQSKAPLWSLYRSHQIVLDVWFRDLFGRLTRWLAKQTMGASSETLAAASTSKLLRRRVGKDLQSLFPQYNVKKNVNRYCFHLRPPIATSSPASLRRRFSARDRTGLPGLFLPQHSGQSA